MAVRRQPFRNPTETSSPFDRPKGLESGTRTPTLRTPRRNVPVPQRLPETPLAETARRLHGQSPETPCTHAGGSDV
jgi:hypothetical protein